MAQIRASIISISCRTATNWRYSQCCCYNPLGRFNHTKPAHILVSISSRSILFPAAPTKSLVLPNLFLPLGIFIDNKSAWIPQSSFSRASCSGTAAILWKLKINLSCWMTSTKYDFRTVWTSKSMQSHKWIKSFTGFCAYLWKPFQLHK